METPAQRARGCSKDSMKRTPLHLCRRGATAIEYALLAALIAIASLMAFQISGVAVSGTFNNAASAMPAPGNAETLPPTKG